MDNPLIVICARAGSKRLPNKAVLNMNGIALCEWTFDQAVDTGFEIVVSSDSQQVLGLADSWGLYSYERKPGLCGDDIPKLDVIRDAVIHFEKEFLTYHNPIIDLDITNPLRMPDDIKNALEHWQKNRPPTLFSAVKSRRNPNFNQIKKTEGGLIGLVSAREIDSYDMNASILIMDRDWLFRGRNHPVELTSEIYLMEDWQRTDIDTEDDWDIVEMQMVKHEISNW